MATPVLIALVVFVLSLAGTYAPRAIAAHLSSGTLQDLTGVAAGLLLSSALLVVLPEGFHVATEGAGDDGFVYRPAVLGATALAGFVFMLLLEGFGVGHAVHEEHHDHVEGHGHGHVHHPTSARVLAVGLSVHALADGIAIGAASAAGEASFSLLVAFAVMLHRVPEAFSLGVFARNERDSGGERDLWMFALATPIAIIVSYLVLDQADDRLLALALLFSGGTFLYVATVDILPMIHNPETGRRAVRNLLVGGVLFALALVTAEWAGVLDHGH